MTALDATFVRVCAGDRAAFVDWMGRVERPIRASLGRFARAVDVESVVQETLLRMWLFASDRGSELTGENASLRFAIGMARNIARNEARRLDRQRFLPPDDLPEIPVEPDPVPDSRLATLIQECLEWLSGKPRSALQARIRLSPQLPDHRIAEGLRMTLNTFLQNIVRARRQMKSCLESRGVRLDEVMT